MKRFWLPVLVVGALAVPLHAAAAEPARPASSTAAALATGEVLEIDSKEQRMLVNHGPIASLGMDAMTMEFRVPDRKLLRRLKAGDRIRFAVLWRNGDYEITRAEVTAHKAATR